MEYSDLLLVVGCAFGFVSGLKIGTDNILATILLVIGLSLSVLSVYVDENNHPISTEKVNNEITK